MIQIDNVKEFVDRQLKVSFKIIILFYPNLS